MMWSRRMRVLAAAAVVQATSGFMLARPWRAGPVRAARPGGMRMDLVADPALPLQLLFCAGMLGTGNRLHSSELHSAASVYMEADLPREREVVLDEVAGVPTELSSNTVDIFRDSPLRYMGYANELGEAFRPLVPGPAVLASYGVAVAYVLADAASKSLDEGKSGARNAKVRAVAAAVDVLVFQLLASVACPGFTINRWVEVCTFLSNGAGSAMVDQGVDPALVETMVNCAPTAGGLLLIPFIVKPLDTLVEVVLDRTLRPFMAQVVERT